MNDGGTDNETQDTQYTEQSLSPQKENLTNEETQDSIQSQD